MQDGMGGSINHDINECEVAKEVLEEMRSKWDEPDKVAVCLVLFWSDGFRKCNEVYVRIISSQSV